MKILRSPTFGTAEQADIIHDFLGEFKAAFWQEYYEDIQGMYEEIKEHSLENNKAIVDDVNF